MGIDVSRLRAFLNRPGIEGPQQLRGYVPCTLTAGGSRNYTGYDSPAGYVPMGASGVTVATGCDLGQQTAQSLDGVGLDLLRKLAPYLGKRKGAALLPAPGEKSGTVYRALYAVLNLLAVNVGKAANADDVKAREKTGKRT